MKRKTLQFSVLFLGLVGLFYNAQAQGNRRSSFRVNSPAIISGYKIIDEADSLASNPSPWGTSVDQAWENYPVAYDPTNIDGCLVAGFPAGYFNGKFALINRGGCEFGEKAIRAQNAGAIGVIIVNNLLGVVGMGGGTQGINVEIPVIMVTNADGAAMRNQIATGNPVNISLTDWRFNPVTNPTDIGFMNDGPVFPIARAIPRHQLNTALTSDENFRVFAGARFYNFSTDTFSTFFQKGVLSYNPAITGGSFSLVDSNSVNWNFASPITTLDSLLAVHIDTLGGVQQGFDMNDEALGRYRVVNTMNIVPNTETASAMENNTWTYDYVINDSVYSKCEYDFTNNRPVVNSYVNTNAAVEWGPVLYIRNGSFVARKAQVVIMRPVIDDSVFNGQEVFITLSKWDDADANGAIEPTTELTEIATGSYVCTAADIVPFGGKVVTIDFINSIIPGNPVVLDPESKYWVHVTNLGNATGTNNWSFGADYYSDYSANLNFGISEGNPLLSAGTMFGGGFANAGSPSIAVLLSSKTIDVNDVTAIHGNVKVYPNPTNNIVNVEVKLDNASSQVTYQLVDITGKVISSETHKNVQSEIYSQDISKLAVGSYFVKITTDEGSKQVKISVVGR